MLLFLLVGFLRAPQLGHLNMHVWRAQDGSLLGFPGCLNSACRHPAGTIMLLAFLLTIERSLLEPFTFILASEAGYLAQCCFPRRLSSACLPPHL